MRALVLLAAPVLFGCAAPAATAPDALAQAERIGRLESERATAVEVAKKERAGRVEAEVRAAVAEYVVAIGKSNLLTSMQLCDKVRGLPVDPNDPESAAAEQKVRSFLVGCGKDEPGDECVARKARDAAQR